MGRSDSTRRVLAVLVCIAGLARPVSSLAQSSPSSPTSRASAVTFTGVVTDTAGAPVRNAVVSLVGGVGVSGVSDRNGRVTVSGVTPGSYLVRTFAEGYTTASTVVQIGGAPQGWSVALARPSDVPAGPTVLAAGMGPEDPVAPSPESAQPVSAPAPGEFIWRLRHLRRSALKDLAQTADAADGPGTFMEDSLAALGHALGRPVRRATDFLADFPLAGHIDLMTTTSFDRPQDMWTLQGEMPRGLASIALSAPVGESGRWQLRGGATQGELTSWMIAGSYSVRPDDSGHAYEAGMSFAAQRYADPTSTGSDLFSRRSAGELYVADTWTLGTRWRVSYGGRYARYDYLSQPGLLSPRLEVSTTPWPGHSLRVTGSLSRRFRAPGAEEFQDGAHGIWLPAGRSFSPLVSAAGFVAERIDRVGLAVEQPLMAGLVVEGSVFRQAVDNQLSTVFGTTAERTGHGTRHYLVTPTGNADVRGWSAGLARRTSSGLQAGLSYTDASARWVPPQVPARALLAAFGPAAVHAPLEHVRSLTGSSEGRLPWVCTQFAVLYRLDVITTPSGLVRVPTPARFDVQLAQALPFFRFNGAEWQAVVSLRNLVYTDAPDASVYDEISVIRSPKLVAGGVTVRF